tara:strand:+ start:371 stop:487 length:117 start_codon:yes stop_codon:yes gene_type:complete
LQEEVVELLTKALQVELVLQVDLVVEEEDMQQMQDNVQ